MVRLSNFCYSADILLCMIGSFSCWHQSLCDLLWSCLSFFGWPWCIKIGTLSSCSISMVQVFTPQEKGRLRIVGKMDVFCIFQNERKKGPGLSSAWLSVSLCCSQLFLWFKLLDCVEHLGTPLMCSVLYIIDILPVNSWIIRKPYFLTACGADTK